MPVVDVPFRTSGPDAGACVLRLLPLTAGDGRLTGILALTPSREQRTPS